jgi:hypothetical protein
MQNIFPSFSSGATGAKRSRYKKDDDPDLVQRCLDNKRDAWEMLVRRYRRLIYSIAIKFRFQEVTAPTYSSTSALRCSKS